MIRCGKYGGERVEYPDGIGFTIWERIGDDSGDEDESGVCFDFPSEDVSDILSLIEQLKTDPTRPCILDPAQQEAERIADERAEKWWVRLKRRVRDIGLHITPFEWGIRLFFVSRPRGFGKQVLHVLCNGFMVGPVTVTW
jgi:hypothetical protein